MAPLGVFRHDVQSMHAYAVQPSAGMIKLDAMENPHRLPPGLREDLGKRLAEVDFPIAAVSAHAVKEKSIRHGHPSTLHLWWARRPLAACRAVLFASLVDDPDSDPDFRKPDGSLDEERAAAKRAQLFDLI